MYISPIRFGATPAVRNLATPSTRTFGTPEAATSPMSPKFSAIFDGLFRKKGPDDAGKEHEVKTNPRGFSHTEEDNVQELQDKLAEARRKKEEAKRKKEER